MSGRSAEICPKCGSGKVEECPGVGDCSVICFSCGWTGSSNELLSVDLGSVAEKSPEINAPDLALGIAQEVSKTYFLLIARDVSHPLGKAMLQAGVVGLQQSKELGRLIRVACLAAHKATLEEIEKMQKELQNAQRDN